MVEFGLSSIMGACIGARAAGLVVLILTASVCVLLYEGTRITMVVRVYSNSPKFSAAGHTAAHFQSARLCNRINPGPMYVNETQGPYNPAAVRHPRTGEWYLVFTMDEIWFGISNYTRNGTYLEGRMRSHPLLSRMGKGPVPSSQAQGAVSMLDLDEGYMQKAWSEGSDIYKAADWRPFVWKDQIYLGHWVAYLPAQERIAISVLNLEKGRTELVHRFSSLSKEIEESVWPEELVPKVSHSLRRGLLPAKPKPGTQPAFRREKNWGFMEEDGVLLITYALLPCTVVLEFNPAQPEDLKIRSRHCYVADAPAILGNAGLDILNAAMHISGNPVPFDIHNGDAHEEYLVLLHTKSLEYVNRAVRMDRATKRITHVSAGPVLRIQDYRNEGFLQTAMVVSSFHVLPKEGGAQTPADTFVRIFYGEGDRYGCWLDIDMRYIVWYQLEPSMESSLDASLAFSMTAAKSGSQHLKIARI